MHEETRPDIAPCAGSLRRDRNRRADAAQRAAQSVRSSGERRVHRSVHSHSFVSTALDNSIRGTLDFTGAVTLWQYHAAGEQPLSITCDLSIREGAVKLVAYDENGGMTELLSQSASSGLNGAASVLNASLRPGMNTVKLIGARNTKLDFEFTFAPGTP